MFTGHFYDTLITTISSRFSSNSEAFASELLDNLEEMFLIVEGGHKQM